MDAKQEQAVKRLLKKLSALRATLNNDERRMLDELVISTPNEVELQSMKLPQKLAQKLADADEVKTQSMKLPQKLAQKLADADEVKTQSMKDERKWERTIGVVVFDPNKEEYQRIG